LPLKRKVKLTIYDAAQAGQETGNEKEMGVSCGFFLHSVAHCVVVMSHPLRVNLRHYILDMPFMCCAVVD